MKAILITGASSGIGAALAEFYASPNTVLFLVARNKERLEQIAAKCRDRGSEVTIASIDVTDREALRAFIEKCDQTHPLDLVIANAGVSNGGKNTTEENDRKIFAVNFDGCLNTVYPTIDFMRARRRGQIAIMSSLAGIHGIPRAPAYSASKAAVRVFGEALRNKLKRDNIKVSVICPGFVKTPLTDKNDYPMPFLMPVKKAARIIAWRLSKNRGLIVFPFPLYFVLWALRLLPARLIERITYYL